MAIDPKDVSDVKDVESAEDEEDTDAIDKNYEDRTRGLYAVKGNNLERIVVPATEVYFQFIFIPYGF